jgi:protein involved in polysaccharide export with SLBB domain
MVCCRERVEPGVFGNFRPVLLLPEGITERLSSQQLHAVLAHELCHVRRGDNFTAAIHMFVESLFWFHPLVWWIKVQLIEEQERACDEEVLRRGGDPVTYAESILKICEFYLTSPLMCVSGISGSNLKKRIEAIMKNRVAPKLTWSRIVLLTVGVLTALMGPAAIGAFHAKAAPIKSEAPIPREAPPTLQQPVAMQQPAPAVQPSSSATPAASEPVQAESAETPAVPGAAVKQDARDFIENLRSRLTALEREDASLAVRYSPGYPLRVRLAQQIRELRAVLQEPQDPFSVSILGAVKVPGIYILRGQKSLLDALAMAQGLADDAGSMIRIRPRTPNSAREMWIDVKALFEGGRGDLNIQLFDGDVINVIPAGGAAIFVTGEVTRPGTFPMRNGRSLTVTQAIALANGFTPVADKKATQIIRMKPNGLDRETVVVDLGQILRGDAPDMTLQPNDIVLVPALTPSR